MGENAMKGKCRLMPNQTKLSGWTPGLLQQIIHASKREIKRGVLFSSFIKARMDNHNKYLTGYINLQRNEIVNGVFKDFINSRGIKPIWDNVGFLR